VCCLAERVWSAPALGDAGQFWAAAGSEQIVDMGGRSSGSLSTLLAQTVRGGSTLGGCQKGESRREKSGLPLVRVGDK